jgi:rhodanese-related sulfurtransferase
MFHPQLPSVDVAAVPAEGFLLDVREDDEWAAGHAEQAVHIPMSELPARVAEVPDDRVVHVVCKAGGRSAQVARYLIGQGVEAVNVDGGMLAWQASGRPLVTDGQVPAHVL